MNSKGYHTGYKQLLFDVRRSTRYHNARRGFFESFQLICQVITTLSGTAAIYTILNSLGKPYVLASSGISTFFSVLNLLVTPSKRALLSADLAKRFINLESELVGLPSPTSESINAIIKKRLEIEKDEPPILKTLDSFCHNDEVLAGGYKEENLVVFKWYHHIFKHLFDINTQAIRPAKPVEKQ